MADSPLPEVLSSEGVPEASYGEMPSPPEVDFDVDLDFPPDLPPEYFIVDPGPIIVGTSSSTGYDQKLQVTGQSYFSDNVAIGVTYATEKLHVGGNILVEGDVSANLFYGDLIGSSQQADSANIANNVSGQKGSVLYNIENNLTSTSPNFTFDSTKLVLGDSTPTLRLSVLGDSYFTRIGIGKTNPLYPLDVTGSGVFSNTVTATTFIGDLQGTAERAEYADFAANVESTLFAETAENVIGGIASVRQLSVSGISTLTNATVGVLTASTIYLPGSVYDEGSFGGNPGQILTRGTTGIKWDVVGNLLPPLQTIEVLDTGVGLTHYVSRINFIDGSDPNNIVDVKTGISTEYANITVSDRWTLVGFGTVGLTTSVFRMSSVGIGTTVPMYQLDVRGSLGVSSSLFVGGATTFSTTLRVGGASTFNSSVFIGGQTEISNNNLIVSGTGNVGIGSTLPTFKLDVAGDIRSVGLITSINLFVSGIATIGFLTASNIRVSGSATVGFISASNINVLGVATVGFLTASNIRVSGSATVGFLSTTDLFASGISTVGFLTASNIRVSGSATVGFLSTTDLFASGISTVGFLTASNIRVSGSATVGFLSSTNASIANNLIVSGISTVGFLTASNIRVSGSATVGFLSSTNLFVSGIATVGFLSTTDIYVSDGIASIRKASIVSLDARDLYVSGVTTVGFVTASNLFVVGAVTATNFYGNLVGIVSTSSLSFYSDKSGISTSVIGGIASVSQLKVSGISTLGVVTASNIFVTGVITATSFYGDLVGLVSFSYYSDYSGISTSVIGGIASVTELNVSGISTLGVVTASDLFVSGISTVGFLTASSIFSSDGATLNNVQIGITDNSKIDTITGDLDLDSSGGAVKIGNRLYVSGISTFQNYIQGNSGAYFGRIQITITDDNIIDTTDGILVLDSNEGTVKIDDALNVTGISTFDSNVTLKKSLSVVGITTLGFVTASNIRVSGVVTAINFYGNLIGIADTSKYSYYADKSGISTSVIGGIASVSQLQVSGISTLSNQVIAEKSVLVKENLIVDDKVGIGSSSPTQALDVDGNVAITGNYYGLGDNLVGIVTQLVPGIGIDLVSTQQPGKGQVKVQSYRPIGKTIYVSQNGDDDNTGLAENYPKRTIKAAAAVALYGDTIKVFPGTYVEENPIVLAKTVSIEGTELRNCVITPRYLDRDLFYVNNGCHITDISFIGPQVAKTAAVVSFQPLLGVEEFRYFDAARMIRMNLDYIAKESVGFLTSGFSGFAGGHREQDAARLIDKNLNYIAAEAVGFLTSPTGYNFILNNSDYTNCREDVVSIMSAVSYDLKANSNRKSIGAALSYFNSSGGLIHITGIATQQATIAALQHAVGIAKSVINNVSPPLSYQVGVGSVLQVKDPSVISVVGGCVGVGITIAQLVGIVTTAIGLANTSSLPPIRYGVTLETDVCSKDIRSVWKAICFDITRGGNSKSVSAGKAYYDDDWNLLSGILKNPQERAQTVATIDYSFNIARSIVNNCTWGGYPVGLGTTVTNAKYSKETGITTITAINHGLSIQDPVRVTGLAFTCDYDNGATALIYPDGSFGDIFPVHRVVGVNTFEVVVGVSTVNHYYSYGGTVQKYTNYQQIYSQVKDLSIQPDPLTGFNNSINSCQNVISAMRSCVGVVTSIVGLGSTANIVSRYTGNSGIGFTTVIGVSTATYDHTSGRTTILAPGLVVKRGEYIELYDLLFSCASGINTSTQKFPSGYYGNEFCVNEVYDDESFDIYVGVSTIPHTYVGGGYIINRSIGISTAKYDNLSGITTITAPGAYVRVGDFVSLYNLKFSCNSGAGTTTIYPTGKNGYTFQVTNVVGLGNTFVVNVGKSTIPHTYVSGGIVKPPYSKGVGNVVQGPYVRNCTNFISNSVGMKVDGFHAEPGDQEDVGVTGAMSVDSYTQYNQGGIGVSITNGSYCQLVSIFTICTDTAIFTGAGGQCDITNSNSSFGNRGLTSYGVGDNKSGSIYRYTGVAKQTAESEQDTIVISGIGSLRPYDGQAIYFGELYYTVQTIQITNPGSGYVIPPDVVISAPTGPDGITAEGSANINENGQVVSVDLISTGNQYLTNPSITFVGGGGAGAAATSTLSPIYYTIERATLPESGTSTVILAQNLNNRVSAGTTVYFSRLSLQIATTISFEWVGAGTDIFKAKPGLGGVVVQDNEVVKLGGGEVVYTSTDQAGNFRIGEGVVINQITGTISGRAFSQSLLNTVTPLIIALSK